MISSFVRYVTFSTVLIICILYMRITINKNINIPSHFDFYEGAYLYCILPRCFLPIALTKRCHQDLKDNYLLYCRVGTYTYN